MANEEKEILTGKEVQQLLDISRTTLWKLRKERGFPSTRVGRGYRYLRSEVMAWLKELRYHEGQLPLQF